MYSYHKKIVFCFSPLPSGAPPSTQNLPCPSTRQGKYQLYLALWIALHCHGDLFSTEMIHYTYLPILLIKCFTLTKGCSSNLNVSWWLIYLIDRVVDNLLLLVFTFPPTQHTVNSFETQFPIVLLCSSFRNFFFSLLFLFVL